MRRCRVPNTRSASAEEAAGQKRLASTMVYVRAGTVTEQPSIVTRVLDLPMTIYRFFMFFVMTLIDVRCFPALCTMCTNVAVFSPDSARASALPDQLVTSLTWPLLVTTSLLCAAFRGQEGICLGQQPQQARAQTACRDEEYPGRTRRRLRAWHGRLKLSAAEREQQQQLLSAARCASRRRDRAHAGDDYDAAPVYLRTIAKRGSAADPHQPCSPSTAPLSFGRFPITLHGCRPLSDVTGLST